MTVHVFLDEDENAEGQLYMDDGSSIGEQYMKESPYCYQVWKGR